MLTVTCPHCGIAQQTTAQIGQQTPCAHCGKFMTLYTPPFARLNALSMAMGNLALFMYSAFLLLFMSAFLLLIGGCMLSIALK
jgi:hypothetical protein